MAGFFASPSLFSAYAVLAPAGRYDPAYPDPPAPDPDLAMGAHLRLLPSPLLGFPITPFLVWQVMAEPREIDLLWVGAEGNPPDLGDGREITGWVKTASDDDAWRVGIEVGAAGGAELEVAAYDASGRQLGLRRRPPYVIGAPDFRFIRIRGRGAIRTVSELLVGKSYLFRRLFGQQQIILGLPVDERPRYTGGQSVGPCLNRVKRGAPQRLGPIDRPDGPFDGLDAAAELERVHRMQPLLDRQVENLLEDDGLPNWQRRLRVETPAGETWQRADAQSAGTLLLQSLDPGIGRYLGLMTCVDEAQAPLRSVFVAVGAFAFDPGRRLATADPERPRMLGEIIGEPDEWEPQLFATLAHTFARAPDLAQRLRGQGLRVQTFLAPALVAPLPELPPAPTLAAGFQQWNSGEVPSRHYRQSLSVSGLSTAPLCAFARSNRAEWQSLHPPLDDPAPRREAMLVGRGEEFDSGLLSDPQAPADPDVCSYRVRLGDLFGRFGDASEIEVHVPPRPVPPPPALETELVLTEPDHNNKDPASPGTLRVLAATPPLERRGGGSLEITTLRLQLGDDQSPPLVAQSPLTEFSFVLPELLPQKDRKLKLEGWFVDAGGTESGKSAVQVEIADRRMPDAMSAPTGLLWTSRAGPDPMVEMRLRWLGRSGERYKVFLADARSLVDADENVSRAEVARAIGRLHNVSKREVFRLVTDPPLQAGPDGIVAFSQTLPRTLSTVQVLRIVPVSGRNVEADFAACGLIPVAVPTDRPPGPPSVTATVDAQGRATVRIVAPDLTKKSLEQSEPGLFSPGQGRNAAPPEFRLRKASGTAPDPIYARTMIANAPLRWNRPDSRACFSETVADPADLEAYVRYTYWAEVRMPPERRIAKHPGHAADEQAAAGPALLVEPWQKEDAVGSFSPASMPASVMYVPKDPPALKPKNISAARVPDPNDPAARDLVVTVSGLKPVHPRAIAPARLNIWMQVDGGVIEPLAVVDLTADGTLSWRERLVAATAAAAVIRLHVTVTDPVGRMGPVRKIAVAGA